MESILWSPFRGRLLIRLISLIPWFHMCSPELIDANYSSNCNSLFELYSVSFLVWIQLNEGTLHEIIQLCSTRLISPCAERTASAALWIRMSSVWFFFPLSKESNDSPARVLSLWCNYRRNLLDKSSNLETGRRSTVQAECEVPNNCVKIDEKMTLFHLNLLPLMRNDIFLIPIT